jgi:caa(3)-type oxidase subunit IV
MMYAHVTVRKTIGTWLNLLVLTALSFGASKIAPSGGLELVVALSISMIKTFLVLSIFMHLAEQRFASRLIVTVTFLFIGLLVTLTAADPLTRKTYPRTPDVAARPKE